MATISEHRGAIAGVETFWRSAQPDSGSTPVVFVHGVPTNSDIWVPFLDRCGGIAPDLPGFGRSGKPAGFDYSVGGLDEFLEALLGHAGIDRFSLVVHDWGAFALATAGRMPERLERLVVFNCLPLLPGYRWHRVARLWRRPVVGELTMGFSTRLVMKHALREATATPGSMPQDFLDSVYGHFDHGTQRAILKLYRSAPEEALPRWGRDLGKITAPALVLWGAEDPYDPPEFAQAYADALGGEVRLELVEDAGHWAWIDRPELIDKAAGFLAA